MPRVSHDMFVCMSALVSGHSTRREKKEEEEEEGRMLLQSQEHVCIVVAFALVLMFANANDDHVCWWWMQAWMLLPPPQLLHSLYTTRASSVNAVRSWSASCRCFCWCHFLQARSFLISCPACLFLPLFSLILSSSLSHLSSNRGGRRTKTRRKTCKHELILVLCIWFAIFFELRRPFHNTLSLVSSAQFRNQSMNESAFVHCRALPFSPSRFPLQLLPPLPALNVFSLSSFPCPSGYDDDENRHFFILNFEYVCVWICVIWTQIVEFVIFASVIEGKGFYLLSLPRLPLSRDNLTEKCALSSLPLCLNFSMSSVLSAHLLRSFDINFINQPVKVTLCMSSVQFIDTSSSPQLHTLTQLLRFSLLAYLWVSFFSLSFRLLDMSTISIDLLAMLLLSLLLMSKIDGHESHFSFEASTARRRQPKVFTHFGCKGSRIRADLSSKTKTCKCWQRKTDPFNVSCIKSVPHTTRCLSLLATLQVWFLFVFR